MARIKRSRVRKTGDRGGKRSGAERRGQEPLERFIGLPDFGPARREESVDRVAERVVGGRSLGRSEQGRRFPGRDDVVAGAGARLDAVEFFALALAKVRVELLQPEDR